MKKNKPIILVLYLVILILLFSWVTDLFKMPGSSLPYSEIVSLLEEGRVKSFVVEDQVIALEVREAEGKTKVVHGYLTDLDAFQTQMKDVLAAQTAAGTLESYDFRPEKRFKPMDLLWPILLAGGILLFVQFFMMSRANAGNQLSNFGKARPNIGLGDDKKVTFADVAGADEEKQELQEVVDFLKNPGKYTEIGARIPHGMLLVGPPGTGKTLLAKATAGEAGVPFLSISGSDFVEMYVGVGASRVRDLFEQAKKVAPAIIFIDEIDAVGRKRGSGMGGGHDEKEQTLNQLLVEMDGFARTEGVIVLAATNRPDILDPALLRPGRFDRQVHVGVPDAKGRKEILRVHARNKRLAENVDLGNIALATSGFTGADLSNLLNEAAILAARENRQFIEMTDLDEAMMKVVAGPEKRSRLRLKKDLYLTAVHESGHAVAMHSLPTHDPVRQITIIPRGQALGLTWSSPRADSTHLTRNEMYEQIVGLLGGRVAEALFLDDISTGASNDIDRASKLARDMVARYGMCARLGTVSYTSDGEVFIGRDFEKTKSYSEQVAGTIDEEVKKLIDQAYADCEKILSRDREKLMKVVDFLMEHETMTGVQFEDCMAGRAIGEASATSLFDDFKEE